MKQKRKATIFTPVRLTETQCAVVDELAGALGISRSAALRKIVELGAPIAARKVTRFVGDDGKIHA
jgi:hypothetical protein